MHYEDKNLIELNRDGISCRDFIDIDKVLESIITKECWTSSVNGYQFIRTLPVLTVPAILVSGQATGHVLSHLGDSPVSVVYMWAGIAHSV
jgi:hypothetical protein